MNSLIKRNKNIIGNTHVNIKNRKIITSTSNNSVEDKKRLVLSTNNIPNDLIKFKDEKKLENKIKKSEDKQNRLTVSKNCWYVLQITCKGNIGYKKGIIQIYDSDKKNLIFPIVKLPNIIYTNLEKIDTIESLNKLKEFNLYFKTGDYNWIHLISENLDFTNNIKKVNEADVRKNINIWKLRRLFDLELINYYLEKLDIPLDKNFENRYRCEYIFSKNKNLLDKYINNLKLDLKYADDISTNYNVLYLVHSSLEYENIGYTLRTHNLLNNANNDGFRAYCVTRYGYPYDRPENYYSDDKIKTSVNIDNVTYLKLINGNDNYNTNTLEDYLKKYIVETIKLAHNLDAKVIHATTNFWNGLAAVYAAKYLGIKSVYEIRGFWEESTIAFNPELYESDLLKMRTGLENFILENCDKIITINNILKDDILRRNLKNVNEKKIDVVSNGVEIEKFSPNIQNKLELKEEYALNNCDFIIGYIGSILVYEGIEYIINSIKKIKDDHNLNFKLILIGDGNYKEEIQNYVRKQRMSNYFLYLGKKENRNINKFYDLFDVVVYPRKNLTVCKTTSSSKVIEALSMAKPIIVSDLPAWKDVIKDRETGLYFKPDDVNDLTEKIMELYKDKELRENIGNKAREWVLENRDWKIIGNNLRDLLINL